MRREVHRTLSVVLVLLAVSCGRSEVRLPEPRATVHLETAGISDGTVERRHTCDGEDVSPPLRWSGIAGASGWVITMIDPDAPGGDFVHWVVFGIPGSETEIEEGSMPDGARVGRNDFEENVYRGPCPPADDDPHRYVLTLYAVDREADLSSLQTGASIAEVIDAIQCCVVAKGEVTGSYAR